MQQPNISSQQLNDFIAAALREDVGNGDHSARSCIPETAMGSARLLVKDTGVLAGVALAEAIFAYINPQFEVELVLTDGAKVQKGDVAFWVTGPIRDLLTAERLVLNCMQRMSGIATLTRRYVDAIAHTQAKVLDTRKTTPCLRFLEKWAVRIGGGYNHRFGLYDMVMIKDNHHDFCGGITASIFRVNDYLRANNLQIPIELEVRNLEELDEALSVGNINRIMFDNFDVATTKKAVERVSHRFETESSGGITLDTIRGYAETGVDYISVGALTHSAVALDLSLKAVK